MQIWLSCWNCENETLQVRLRYALFHRAQEVFSKEEDGSISDRKYLGLIASHALYECMKCKAPNFHFHEYWPTEGTSEEGQDFRKCIELGGLWKDEKLFRYYHFTNASNNPIPEWTKDLPERLMTLFWETYKARASGLPSLCAMGIRAIIDVYAVSKIGDMGGFDKKLTQLKSLNFISESQYQALCVVTDSGNAAAHRGFSPSKQDINTSLAVLEAIFYFETNKTRLKSLETSIPPRPNKAQSAA